MRFAICNEIFKELPFDRACALAKLAGYDALELAPDANDWMNHLGPGIIALLIFIALITLDIICLVNMRDWLTGFYPVRDREGRVAAASFMMLDITARRQAADESAGF